MKILENIFDREEIGSENEMRYSEFLMREG